jgi:hypothetical protein
LNLYTAQLLAQGFLEHAASVDFSNWHVFFADERHVPNDHPDSNFKACLDAFLSKVRTCHCLASCVRLALVVCTQLNCYPNCSAAEQSTTGSDIIDLI